MMPFNDLAPFHLAEVTIERFKAAFKPGPIALRPFTVIIGRNGSGKSTVLEALQWLDTTIRRDAREACERYFGMSDLINLRGKTKPHFRLGLRWDTEGEPALSYSLKVDDDGGLPLISEERLTLDKEVLVETGKNGERRLFPVGHSASSSSIEIPDRDRLSLNYASAFQDSVAIRRLREFWSRAVFLRLSPNRLAYGSPATRRSFDPLLDEEGQLLPALLHELSKEQRAELSLALQEILPGIQSVEVDKNQEGRDTRTHYRLVEKMPYKGRSGRSHFPIPAWMLSEGTRRITAILALLVRDPPPSILCIEEIENGLDPWTILTVLKELRSAADRGVQVILTTHSLWLLDHVELDDILQVDRIDGDTRYQRFRDRQEVQAFQASIPPGSRYYWG